MKRHIIPLLTDFPILQQYRLLAKAVAELSQDQGLYEGLWARAEWYLDPANGKGYDGNELEAVCAVANFFSIHTNPVLTDEDRELIDYSPEDTELDVLTIGEGGMMERMVEHTPEYGKLNNFLNDVFDGDDNCPHHGLFSGNAEHDMSVDFIPKYEVGQRVILSAVVRELDEFCEDEEFAEIIEAQTCEVHGVFHPGMSRMYLVGVEGIYRGVLEASVPDDGVREVDEDDIRPDYSFPTTKTIQ